MNSLVATESATSTRRSTTVVVLIAIYSVNGLVFIHNKSTALLVHISISDALSSDLLIKLRSAHRLLHIQQNVLHQKRRIDMPENGSINEANTGTRPGSGGTATALSETAHDYGQKISEVASQAKDYVTDKVSVVGDKIKGLQNADIGELAENAKDYARQNPGQALLISAAAGLFLGLIIRGRR